MTTQTKKALPQWLYELLRIGTLFVPVAGAIMVMLNDRFSWGFNETDILAIFAAIETAVAAVFNGSKLVTDEMNK